MVTRRQKKSDRRRLGIPGEAQFVMLVLLAAAVALLGGSARIDVPHLLILRPLVCLFLGFALFHFGRDDWRTTRTPLVFLLLLALLTALQLVPLPYGLWSSLPGRDVVVELSKALEVPEIARPLSLVPARTASALAGLVVPLTGLLLFAVCRRNRFERMLYVVIVLGLANSLLGILQTIAGEGPLYSYPISNVGSPVGFFANNNHSAMFSALALLIVAYVYSVERLRNAGMTAMQVLLPAIYFVIFTTLLSNGSRAGLLVAAVALALSGLMFSLTSRQSRARQGVPSLVGSRAGNKLVVGLFVATSILLIVIFFAFGDIPALRQMLETNSFEDIRGRVLPTLFEMIGTFILPGSGFGTFENVYYIFEADALLKPAYLNQAHNDWAQWLIEGGALGALLLLAFLGWLGLVLVRIYRLRTLEATLLLMLAAGFMLICGLASVVDYPLRTALFQLVATWITVGIALRERQMSAKVPGI